MRQSSSINIAQLNLVEGYIVGREGLKDTKIKVSNATTNGTIPLAYADVIKRQNLFGINSAAPSAGWGTAQVTQDGSGTALDSNYIMDNIPAGNLEGFLGEDVTTTQLKTEIARSVPAVTYYNEDGVESLLTVGTFENNTNYVRYNDVVGSVEVKSYSGRDVQPALSFEFGLGKNELKVTNVEQSIYSSSYVLDSVGLTPVQKLAMWTAGREIYKRHGLTTTQTVRRYPLVNDAAGAYRIAMALYSNMGYVNGTYYNRQTASFKTHKGVTLDIGEAVNMDMPQVKGVGVVTSVEIGVYGGTNAYVVDMIEAETITEIGDVFETGAQADNINETGTQTDNIIEDGA